jgi:hypothetical protein
LRRFHDLPAGPVDLQYDVNLVINLTTDFPLKSGAFLNKKVPEFGIVQQFLLKQPQG